MKVNTISPQTKTTKRYEFNRSDVIKALIAYGFLPKNEKVTEVYAKVPGGGDWSNMNLDIENDSPLLVETES